MKTKFNKLISMLLVIAFLVSGLTVFAWAEDGAVTEEPETEVELDAPLYNRNFEEGWDAYNGFTPELGSHSATIDYEETSDYKYNYFTRFEYGSAGTGGLNFKFGVDTITSGQTVVQFDIKVDDACDLGRIMYMQTAAGKTINLLNLTSSATSNSLTTVGGGVVANVDNNWTTVTFIFNWDAEDFEVKVLSSALEEPLFITQPYESAGDSGMRNLYIGLYTAGANKSGMNFCIDNLQIYQGNGITEPIDISDMGCGEKVDPLVEKVVDIKESAGGKSVEDLLKEALCLKLGVPYALMRDEKVSIVEYCTPTIVDGKVMIPLLLLLKFIDYPYYVHPDGESYDITTGTSVTYLSAGRDSINVDGKKVDLSVAPGYVKNTLGEDVLVVAIDDIPSIFPGWLLTYDDMGLIIMYEGEVSEDGESSGLISRENDLDTMLTMMKRFVFDTVTTDSKGEALEAVDAYNETGKKVYGDVKANTDNFKHPYIFATQSDFDALNAAYEAAEGAANYNATLKGYIGKLVSKADSIYSEYAKVNEGAYAGINPDKVPTNLYADGLNPASDNKNDPIIADTTDGYNADTKALYEIEEYTELLVQLAFAYQVTGNPDYAKLAYDISVALGNWSHWGPGYMPNCATATSNFAVAYDWLYNAYVELGLDVKLIATILYNQGVKHGYTSSKGLACEFPRSSGEGDVYNSLTNTTNIVCSSGMIIGAIALMEYSEYDEYTTYIVGNNIISLINNGLDQYAPDGAYIESPKHWELGTNSFMKLIMALRSSANDDYGFAGTWGLSSTFYYALYIENSDGEIWNYHDGGSDGVTNGEILGMDTQMFNFAAEILGDQRLVAFREMQIAKGKEISIFDVLFYTEVKDVDTTLELDYVLGGIDAFVSRSDWENGALYVGLMGGLNDCSYGQMDSGNFIYKNEGITWFMDLGSDDPNVYSYYGQYRYYHYRNNAEGQNVPIITSAKTSLPYGQDKAGAGKIVKSESNEHGSYAILDNATAYGDVVSFANRGILVTNDRKTVVVQDEISFSLEEGVGTVYWVAHTAQEITLSDDGRTAYLTGTTPDGISTYNLRVSLVARMSDIRFTVQDEASAGLLDVTFKKNDSFNKGGAAELSREGIKKLLIKADAVPQFNIAIVIEMVDEIGSLEPVGYEWSNMNMWNPSASATGGEEESSKRGNAVKNDIITQAQKISSYYRYNVAFSENIDDFYKALTLVAYTLTYFPTNTFESKHADAYSDYLDYYDDYTEYMEFINEKVDMTHAFADSLAGLAEE